MISSLRMSRGELIVKTVGLDQPDNQTARRGGSNMAKNIPDFVPSQ